MRSSAVLAYSACLGVTLAAARAPGGSPPVQPTAAAALAVSDPPAGPAAYEARLRGLEERVRLLRARVFASKDRLLRLQRAALDGVVAGATLHVVHDDEMGGSFRLARLQCLLDGAAIVSRADLEEGDRPAPGELDLYAGRIAPGPHELAVLIEYRGNGHGIFSYLESYRFRIRSTYAFTADEGKVTTVRVIGFEQGGLTTELADRPAVRYESLTEPRVASAASGSAR